MPMTAAQITAELQRKKSLNIKPTSAANVAQYNKLPSKPIGSMPPPSAPMGQGKPVNMPFKPGTPVSTWGGASPMNGGVNTPLAKPGAVTPTPYSGPAAGGVQTTGSMPPSPVKPTYQEEQQTQYVSRGGEALNAILYRKKQYDEGKANGNRGQLSWATTDANQYYNQLSPEEAAHVKTLNTQGLIDYINSKNQPQQPVSAEPQPLPVPGAAAAPQDAVFAPRSEQDLQDMAGDQNAIERAALKTAIEERMTSIRNSTGYANKLLQDQRVLENLDMDRSLNPFNLKSTYDKAMVNRGRGIDDSARASQTENQLNAIQEELFNFDKLAPERQRQIFNDLLKLEREFGLNVGGLTGNYGGQRTLAGSQFDWQRDMDVSDRTGYIGGNGGGAGSSSFAAGNSNSSYLPQTQTRTLQGKQFDLAETETMAQLTGRLPNGQKTTAEQQRELGNLWTVAQQTGRIPDQLAQIYGIPKGTKTQDAYQFAQQMSLGWDNNQRGWDSNDLDWLKFDQEQQNPGGTDYRGMTANQILDNVKSRYMEPVDPFDSQAGQRLTTNPQQREQMFLDVIDSHLPSSTETRQVLKMLGFTEQEINDLKGKYPGNL